MKEIYLKFSVLTQTYSHPTRYGFDWFMSAIDKVWATKPKRVDWLDFERLLRDVVKSTALNDSQKVRIINEGLAAFTGRGEEKMPNAGERISNRD